MTLHPFSAPLLFLLAFVTAAVVPAFAADGKTAGEDKTVARAAPPDAESQPATTEPPAPELEGEVLDYRGEEAPRHPLGYKDFLPKKGAAPAPAAPQQPSAP